MKVLSLRQPWAALVVHHGKRIENRKWNTLFRGPFLIHAAKDMSTQEFDEAYRFAAPILGDQMPHELDLREELQFAGVVGRAEIVHVVRPNPVDRQNWYPSGVDGRWHMREQYGFILTDVHPVPFIACRGALNFFEAPAEVYETLIRNRSKAGGM